MIAVCQPLLTTITVWSRGPSSAGGSGATLVQAASHPAHSKAVQIVSACRMDAYMDFVP